MSALHPNPTSPARTSGVARLIARLGGLLRGGHSPERIAFSLAAGATLGLFPIFGTSTLLCLAAGVAFRLNHAALQLANQLMYPVQLTLILVFVHTGAFLLGSPAVITGLPGSWSDGVAILQVLARAGTQALVGWAACAPLVAASLYFAVLPLLRKMRRADGPQSTADAR